MINLADYQYENRKVRVVCTNGRTFDGHILAVDDDEEGPFDELSLCFMTDYGRCLGIRQSETVSIEVLT